jgi:hypothetical protein
MGRSAARRSVVLHGGEVTTTPSNVGTLSPLCAASLFLCIGEHKTKGAQVVFETSVDDYAEIWGDGELTRAPGQSGGSVIAGWNAGNQFIVGRNVKPGKRIDIAVFAANGPLSNPPANFIWMRYARLKFLRAKPDQWPWRRRLR